MQHSKISQPHKTGSDPMYEFSPLYRGKKVLITGGAGFVGSSLAVALVKAGADVVVVDAMLEPYGGNLFNLQDVRNDLTVNFNDIRDQNAMNYLVRDKDFVFLCAAQVCHLMSLENPFLDIDINIHGTAVVMEALKLNNPNAIVVKLGSRGQYGSVVNLPAVEDTPSDPKGIHEISLLAAEQIMRTYNRNHNIRGIMLRLTNIYGPRAQMNHDRFCVANWFIRLALSGETIPVFGDGTIQRDFLYIDDCVAAILQTAVTEAAIGEVINVGKDTPSTFLELAKTIVEKYGKGEWELRPFSKERQQQEPGHFYSDISKIRNMTGWSPVTSLENGVEQTLRYYEQYQNKYW